VYIQIARRFISACGMPIRRADRLYRSWASGPIFTCVGMSSLSFA
jgi:hypothetical protein